MDDIEELTGLAAELNKSARISSSPKRIKSGLTVHCLQDFINSKEDIEVPVLRELINKIVLAENENEIADLLFDIYRETFKNLPVTTTVNLLFFAKFISVLALLDVPQPEPPLNLFTKLFYTIPDELITDELVESIAKNMFTVSKDDGDLTHLCMQCAHLESEWNLLTIKISWFVLDYLIKASKRISAKIVNLSKLSKLLNKCTEPDSVKKLLFIVHLVSILINRLALKERGEEAKKSLNLIRDWLSLQLVAIDSLANDPDVLFNMDSLRVKGFITTVLVHWPEIATDD